MVLFPLRDHNLQRNAEVAPNLSHICTVTMLGLKAGAALPGHSSPQYETRSQTQGFYPHPLPFLPEVFRQPTGLFAMIGSVKGAYALGSALRLALNRRIPFSLTSLPISQRFVRDAVVECAVTFGLTYC